MPKLELDNLYISRITWGSDEGQLSGNITFKNQNGKIQLTLSDETCHQILHLCAQDLVLSAQEVAKNLISNVVDSWDRIEDKSKGLDHD